MPKKTGTLLECFGEVRGDVEAISKLTPPVLSTKFKSIIKNLKGLEAKFEELGQAIKKSNDFYPEKILLYDPVEIEV